jgi:hypothetical protein
MVSNLAEGPVGIDVLLPLTSRINHPHPRHLVARVQGCKAEWYTRVHSNAETLVSHL